MSLTKATIIVEGAGAAARNIEVLFNPNEYVIETSNQFSWEKVPGLSAPIAQFISGEAPTLSMDLFFDTSESKEDVRNRTLQVSGLLNVDSDLHAPPICRFVWGSLDFKGIVEKVTQKFTMFLSSGIPVRATLSVTFRAWQSIEDQLQSIPRQSSDRTKQKMLRQGDQLWMMAAQEYEDPGLWREIARANGIDNPRTLTTGKPITIPPLE